MNFNPIDLENWSRKPYFEHYLNNVRCSYSMTAAIDITRLLSASKSMGFKLYPVFLHMITTVVNRLREFRTCYDADGQLGYWDSMSPSYTIFHQDDRTFSSIWTVYEEDFQLFYRRYLEDNQMYGDVKQFAAKANEPANCFSVSSIPWVSFTGFNLNVYNEGTYLLPIFTLGKYERQGDKVLLPLAGQFHHAVCDGYHAGLLYQELQLLADTGEQWLFGK